MTDISTPQYFSSCIAVNGRDSNVLVGSSHLAQIARWDPRSPTTAAFTTAGCRRKERGDVRCRAFDPVYGVQWNPSNSNEFMSVHRNGVRIWDVRNMTSDVRAWLSGISFRDQRPDDMAISCHNGFVLSFSLSLSLYLTLSSHALLP